MKLLYVSGQMRSGTTLVSSFISKQQDFTLLVDQVRILTASGQAFKNRQIAWNAPMPLMQRMKLFQAYVNVTLWAARSKRENGKAIALKRLAPFMGYISQIRSLNNNPQIELVDIIDLPAFRSHLDFYRVLLEHAVPVQQRRTIKYAGNKETRGEDFAAALAQSGEKSIVVIRDPRAVVSSLMQKIETDAKFGVKDTMDEATARWQKGYDICKANPQICLVKYEDFILDHNATVSRLQDVLDADLEAGKGIVTSNSSFADVEAGQLSEAGISRWRDYEDKKLIAAVTERCKDQILDLGYSL